MPEFSDTEYKIQGVTFKSAIFDLQRKLKTLITKSDKRFCSTYIKLLRLRSFEKLSILKSIILTDINNQLHLDLWIEDNRLQDLSKHTLLSFENAIRSRQLQM